MSPIVRRGERQKLRKIMTHSGKKVDGWWSEGESKIQEKLATSFMDGPLFPHTWNCKFNLKVGTQ